MGKKTPFPGAPKQVERLKFDHYVMRTIDQEHDKNVVQYEFYIAAKTWDHTAVKNFRTKLGKISVGATIFKGTTGIWKSPNVPEEEQQEVVEDTHIYRLIKGDITDDEKETIRSHLRDYSETMMLELDVWDESRQEEFLFTETNIFSNSAKLK